VTTGTPTNDFRNRRNRATPLAAKIGLRLTKDKGSPVWRLWQFDAALLATTNLGVIESYVEEHTRAVCQR
jgi:hypothetical protein